jgi:hypothetical protein
MTRTPKTDPALWTVRRKFGVAGGPDEIALTEEGEARAFSVGAQVRRGPAAEALLALWSAQGEGYLSTARGSRLQVTPLGRYDQIAWGHLRSLGYVESIPREEGAHEDGVRLTEAGKAAAWAGILEQRSLLARCHDAAGCQLRQ